MNKKGQALIISLWVLIILTVLAVSIGHRVSLALRLSRYQRDRLKSHYLAHAGLNMAINCVSRDATASYDTLQDTWADNEEALKSIALSDNQNEYASVGYSYTEGENKVMVFGVIDEERKININTASKDLLVALLEKYQVADAQAVAENIRIWRGEVPDTQKIYEDLGYPCKGDKFSNIEELKLVKGITPQDYEKIKGLITIYGADGTGDLPKININTASFEVLNILTEGIAKPEEKNYVAEVINKIITLKETGKIFMSAGDIDSIGDLFVDAPAQNLFNSLKKYLIVSSNNFLIEVSGNVGKIKSRLSCVYGRTEKELLYWHEN